MVCINKYNDGWETNLVLLLKRQRSRRYVAMLREQLIHVWWTMTMILGIIREIIGWFVAAYWLFMVGNLLIIVWMMMWNNNE